MTYDEFKTWLAAQDLRKLHRDQVLKQASRCIEAQEAELDAARHRVARLESEIKTDVEKGKARQKALLELLADGPAPLEAAIARITGVVCRDYGVTPQAVLGSRRTRLVSEARLVRWWLILELTPLSGNDLARREGRNHTSIYYAVETTEHAIKARSQRGRRAARLLALLRAPLAALKAPPPGQTTNGGSMTQPNSWPTLEPGHGLLVAFERQQAEGGDRMSALAWSTPAAAVPMCSARCCGILGSILTVDMRRWHMQLSVLCGSACIDLSGTAGGKSALNSARAWRLNLQSQPNRRA